MSNYTQEQETEIVKDAMTLTTAIQIDEEELKRLKSERFKSKPSAPVHKVLDVPNIQTQIPEAPKTQYRYSSFLKDLLKNKFVLIPTIVILICFIWSMKPFSLGFGYGLIMLIISAVCFAPFILIGTYFLYKQKVNTLNQQLAQSPEYLKAVEDAKRVASEKQQKAKEEIAQKQAEIDEKYQSDLEHYNSVVIPNYNQEYDSWKIAQKLKIEMLEEELQLNKDTLEALYESTRLISLKYRKLDLLCWLYDDMMSADHNIDRAIDLLNDERQLDKLDDLADKIRGLGDKISGAINDMHSSMMSGFHAVYDAIEEGNEELAKARRDQNLANTAGIIQRHNLNKMIKMQNGMLDKHFNK